MTHPSIGISRAELIALQEAQFIRMKEYIDTKTDALRQQVHEDITAMHLEMLGLFRKQALEGQSTERVIDGKIEDVMKRLDAIASLFTNYPLTYRQHVGT